MKRFLALKNSKRKSNSSSIYFLSHPFFHKALLKVCLSEGKRCVIISDTIVSPLYAEPIAAFFKKNQIDTTLITFESGEARKTRETKEAIENQMLLKKLGKESVLIAVGGGVVSDLAGFVAATYCRGIPLITVPTSLMGMVDASIGGKTGVNTLDGKNLLGAIYPSRAIFIDLTTLTSLPDKEFLNGCAEMIKHGLVAKPSFLRWIEKNIKHVKNNPRFLKKAIMQSVYIKKKIVKSDVLDSGKRQILNFGHTIGHAIETTHRYQISHGEAIAIGMLVEGFISLKLGLLKDKEFERINALIRNAGFPLRLFPKINISDVLVALKRDKKAHFSVPRFILLKKIGKVAKKSSQYARVVNETNVQEGLKWMFKEFARK